MRYAELGLILAIGCVAGWLWAIRPGVLAEIEWLHVMTAFGTIGATVAAVVLGVGSWVRLDIERDRKAAAVGWLVIPWLGNIKNGCDISIEFVDAIRSIPAGNPPDEWHKFLQKQALDALDVQRLLQFAGDLHVLRNSTDVSEAIGGAWRLHDTISKIPMSSPLPSPDKRSIFESVSKSAGDLKASVDSSLEAMRKRQGH